MRAQGVDVVLVPPDVGKALRHLLDPAVPIGHGDRDAVRLCGRGQVLRPAAGRELEGEAEDAVDADAAHHRLLDDDLALRAREHRAADRGVLALGVLAHDEEVDVAGPAAGQRRGYARHQPHRPEIDVLAEFAPELRSAEHTSDLQSLMRKSYAVYCLEKKK